MNKTKKAAAKILHAKPVIDMPGCPNYPLRDDIADEVQISPGPWSKATRGMAALFLATTLSGCNFWREEPGPPVMLGCVVITPPAVTSEEEVAPRVEKELSGFNEELAQPNPQGSDFYPYE